MSQFLAFKSIESDIEHFLKEDDLSRNLFYSNSLPDNLVRCSLKIKDDMILSGLPYLITTFNTLGANLDWNSFKEYEGKKFSKGENFEVNFDLPFSIALTGERIALNLLQRSSSISTFTNQFVELAKDIKILDTRKTTPGLRSLEKYAVRLGGGHNHRFGQTDAWMVKDNHKSFFGGVRQAIEFFKNMQGHYTPIILEVHNLEELKEAIELKASHVMLDNFTPEDIKIAVGLKPTSMTYEVSGGIRIDTIENFLIKGVDAISVGSITYGARALDLSLKYKRQ